MAVTKCPICGFNTLPFEISKFGGRGQVPCPNCSTYLTSYEFAGVGLNGWLPSERALIAGWVRDRWRRGESVVVENEDVNLAIQRVARLKPPEKAERLLLLIEKLTPFLGARLNFKDISPADVWAENPAELYTYRNWLSARDLIDVTGEMIELKMEGWAEVERIRQQREAIGNTAFIAMKYGDAPLDSVVSNHFKPACQQAGFELRRLDHKQPAGLIDDQLRVAIRNSKFLICDLTHGNKGAYWEAGFAEGIGRPVIFTCRNDVFDDKTHEHHPHFDTAHMKTIRWDPLKPEVAAAELKITIRATLPSDAKMED
jgi:hypothetical protein